MQKIKFRAWDKEKKIMYLPDTEDIFVCEDIIYISAEIKYNTPNTEIVRLSNAIPLQFTGLKDVNDKEIYESDILIDNSGEKYICEWGESEAGFYLYQVSSARTFYFPDFSNNELKVIGNIYENPELLEEGV